MPQYNLAAPEERIVVSWLFEPFGYLDFAVRISDGQTARQALALDPTLDVTQWVRDNPLTDPQAAETGMVWWIWKNDQVNIPSPQKPPEATEWIAVLSEWKASIDNALAEDPGGIRRDGSVVPLTNEDGSSGGTMPAGAHIIHQRNTINKVLGVLE